MSNANVNIINSGSGNVTPTNPYLGEANATAMLAGEPVKAKIAGSKYVIPLADAEPVINF